MNNPFRKITSEQREIIASRLKKVDSIAKFSSLLIGIIDLLNLSDLEKSSYKRQYKSFKFKGTKADYQTFFIKKSSGGHRLIQAPLYDLRLIQRLINVGLTSVFTPHENAFGYVTGKSIVDNAKIHINHHYVYNIDLSNFFASIPAEIIKKVLGVAPFNLNKGIDGLLPLIVRFCTIPSGSDKQSSDDDISDRCLPQGAPTSPLLSNVVCESLDKKLTAISKKFGAYYSRYADDITFSSNRNLFKEGSMFISEIESIIAEENFDINSKKTRMRRSNQRQAVTGLVVNKKVNVSSKFIKNLRMYLHYWEKYGFDVSEKHFFHDQKISWNDRYSGMFYSTLKGWINFLGMVKGTTDSTYISTAKRFANIKRKHENEILKTIAINKKPGFEKHSPKDVAIFLGYFQDSDGLKYLTHDYDIPGREFKYQNIMETASKELNRAFRELAVTNSLYARVKQFAFEKTPKWWRWENSKMVNINIGWSAHEVEEWTFENPGIHPIRRKAFRDGFIRPFKESIQFRPPKLKSAIEQTIMEKFGEEFPELDIDYVKLETAEFFTDVDIILGGIRHLLDGIFERLDISKRIRLEFKREEVDGAYMKIIEITHLGSVCYKESQPHELLSGNFLEAKKAFHGLCNWSITANFSDGPYRLQMLSDSTTRRKEQVDSNLIDGFTHTLTFY